MTTSVQGVMGGHVVEVTRTEFPESELGTALWLLRECENDEQRIDALVESGGDLAALVSAVEDRLRHLDGGRWD